MLSTSCCGVKKSKLKLTSSLTGKVQERLPLQSKSRSIRRTGQYKCKGWLHPVASGIFCLVYFFWYILSGVYCLVYFVWYILSGIFCLVDIYIVWCILSGVYCLVYIVWCIWYLVLSGLEFHKPYMLCAVLDCVKLANIWVIELPIRA